MGKVIFVMIRFFFKVTIHVSNDQKYVIILKWIGSHCQGEHEGFEVIGSTEDSHNLIMENLPIRDMDWFNQFWLPLQLSENCFTINGAAYFSSLLMEALSSVLDASTDKDVYEAEEYMREFTL